VSQRVADWRFVADPAIQRSQSVSRRLEPHSRIGPFGVHLLVNHRGPDFTNCNRIAPLRCRASTTMARRRHYGASDTGFTVSGVFRDLADFLYASVPEGRSVRTPLFSYLPDGDLTGLVLDFDVTWQASSPGSRSRTLDRLEHARLHRERGGQKVPWFGTSVSRSPAHDRPQWRVGHYTLGVNSPQAGDKVTSVVFRTSPSSAGDFRVAYDYRSGHVVAGQCRV